MGAASLAGNPSLFKTLFTDEEVLDLTYGDNNVLWALLNKETNFTADGEKVPIIIAPPGGRSKTFSTAKTLMGDGGTTKHFMLTRHKDFQLISMDGESIDAAGDDDGAFVDLFEHCSTLGIKNLARQMNFDLYRSGSGSRGVISSVSTTRITLTDVNDAIFFEVGMTLQASTTDSSSGLRTGSLAISAVDRENGYLDAASNWGSSITSIAAADYLFASGDASAGLKGLAAYCPSAAPTGGDSLYSLDRSVDTDRLAGIRAGDLSGYDLGEALLTLNYKINTRGNGLTKVNLMHTLKFAELVKSYASRTIPYVNTKYGNVGFEGISVTHSGGKSVVYGDRDCQSSIMWGLDPEVLTFRSLKMAPRPLDYKETTKNGAHFDPDADGLVLRLGYRGALRNRAPGFMGRATI